MAETKKPNITECTHENIDDGSCIDCGLSISSTGNHLHYEEDYSLAHQRAAAVSTLGIEKDLEGKDLPLEIKAWILRMAASAPKRTLRMASRDRMLFAYTYLAYLEMKYPLEPEKVASILGIDKSQIPEALRLVSGISPTPLPQAVNSAITAPMVVISPVSYLDSVVQVLKMEEYKTQVKEILERALERQPLLYEERPMWMAVAGLKLFLDSQGKSVPKFHEYFSMTSTSIKGCLNKLQAALK